MSEREREGPSRRETEREKECGGVALFFVAEASKAETVGIRARVYVANRKKGMAFIDGGCPHPRVCQCMAIYQEICLVWANVRQQDGEREGTHKS